LRKKISLFIFSLLLLTMPITCIAQDNRDVFPAVPTSNIYLQDYARVINEQTNHAIINAGANLNRQTSAQVVVVTTKSLNDMAIKDYSLGLFRKWGIGNKEKNNGILILVVTSTKQVRIEVGYGLEGRLPDAKCGEIIRDKMLPLIAQGDFNAGILNGYHAISAEVYREYGINPDGASAGSTNNVKIQDSGIQSLPVYGQIAVVLFTVFLFYVFFRMIRTNRSGNGYNGSGIGSGNTFIGGGSGDGGSGGGDSFGGGDCGGGGADS